MITDSIKSEMAEFFDYLAARWEDERGNEDIGRYAAAFGSRFGVKVTAKKKPFSFYFRRGSTAYALLARKDSVSVYTMEPARANRKKKAGRRG
jgi:hypothetical protein